MYTELTAEALEELQKPFPAKYVQWRAGSTTKDKGRALALAYVDARHYQQRLDRLFGAGWEVEFAMGQNGVVCQLTILGKTRGDVGDNGKRNPATSAASQAFKRACAQWGLGRYLYFVDAGWVGYDGKHLTETPSLPKWATPEGWDKANGD